MERITVREVTALAGVNRVTFYAHYPDIFAIREEMEDQLLAGARQHSLRAGEFTREELALRLEGMEKNFRRYGQYMEILMGPHGDPRFPQRLKEACQEEYRKDQHTKALTPEQEYMSEAIFSALTGMLSLWMKNNRDLSLERLAMLFYQVTGSWRKAETPPPKPEDGT